MNKKLDTIHIHGVNLIIIFILIITFAIDKKHLILPSISALNINNNTDNYNNLKKYTDNNKDQLTIKINANKDKLDNKIVGISAIIYDPTDSVAIWSQSPTRSSSLASLTKVMTAFIYKKYCDKDVYFANLTWQGDQAIRYMLVESSNEMADTLATVCFDKAEFIHMMNKEADTLKLNLKYTNTSGIDSPGIIGGRGDVISIAQFLYIASSKYPAIFDTTTHNSSQIQVDNGDQPFYINAINTNKHISSVNGARMSKTGLTDYAGGNLGIVYDVYVGRPLIMVVLGSTKEGRFKDIDLMRHNVEIVH